MDHEELIAKMRGRVSLCRNLATTAADERTAHTLRQMAEEVERDTAALEAPRMNPVQPRSG